MQSEQWDLHLYLSSVSIFSYTPIYIIAYCHLKKEKTGLCLQITNISLLLTAYLNSCRFIFCLCDQFIDLCFRFQPHRYLGLSSQALRSLPVVCVMLEVFQCRGSLPSVSCYWCVTDSRSGGEE